MNIMDINQQMIPHLRQVPGCAVAATGPGEILNHKLQFLNKKWLPVFFSQTWCCFFCHFFWSLVFNSRGLEDPSSTTICSVAGFQLSPFKGFGASGQLTSPLDLKLFRLHQAFSVFFFIFFLFFFFFFPSLLSQ